MAASNPPAEPPIPTIGQAGDDFCFSPAPSGPNRGLTLGEADRRRCASDLFFFVFAGMTLINNDRGLGRPKSQVDSSSNSGGCLGATLPRVAASSGKNEDLALEALRIEWNKFFAVSL